MEGLGRGPEVGVPRASVFVRVRMEMERGLRRDGEGVVEDGSDGRLGADVGGYEREMEKQEKEKEEEEEVDGGGIGSEKRRRLWW